MTLPFSAREFFDVFGRYNAAVWADHRQRHAAREAAAGPGTAGRTVALDGRRISPHFLCDINPAAWVFGIAFVAQAGILLWLARPRSLGPSLSGPPFERLAGKTLVIYALLGYPLSGSLAGHYYPEAPTLGAPCPTTIFTLGILLWMGSSPAWVFAVPLLWTVIGTSAAVQLSVPQDYGLAAAGLLSIGALIRRRSNSGRGAPLPA